MNCPICNVKLTQSWGGINHWFCSNGKINTTHKYSYNQSLDTWHYKDLVARRIKSGKPSTFIYKSNNTTGDPIKEYKNYPSDKELKEDMEILSLFS